MYKCMSVCVWGAMYNCMTRLEYYVQVYVCVCVCGYVQVYDTPHVNDTLQVNDITHEQVNDITHEQVNDITHEQVNDIPTNT